MYKKYIPPVLILISMIFSGTPLSSGELNGKKRIIIGACEWEPYTGESMPGKGLLSEISTEALKRAGYESDVVIYPWARAVIESKNGSIQGLLGAGYSRDRIQYFAYPEEIWITRTGFFTYSGNRTNRKFTTIQNLAPATVGVLDGSNYIEALEKVQGIKTDKVSRVEFNIKKLAYRRIDYLIEDRTAVEYFIEKEVPELKGKVVFLNPPYRSEKIFLVFSRKTPGYKKLVLDFNRGLAEIKKDGTYDRIVRSYGLPH